MFAVCSFSLGVVLQACCFTLLHYLSGFYLKLTVTLSFQRKSCKGNQICQYVQTFNEVVDLHRTKIIPNTLLEIHQLLIINNFPMKMMIF